MSYTRRFSTAFPRGCLIRFYATLAAPQSYVKPFDALPGPSQYLTIRSSLRVLWQSRKRPLGKELLSQQFSDVGKYGRIYKRKFPTVNIVDIADPSAAREVLGIETLGPKFDSPVLEYCKAKGNAWKSSFFANGPDWDKYRESIKSQVTRPRELAEYIPTFNQISDELLERLNSLRTPKGRNYEYEVVNLEEELIKWSFETATYAMFNQRFGYMEKRGHTDAQVFISSLRGFWEALMPLTLLPPWVFKLYKSQSYWKLLHSFDTMYRCGDLFIGKKLHELKRQGNSKARDHSDLFGLLLASGELIEDDLVASVVEFLFTGVDAVSNTMLWALYMMGENPDKQYKLHHEVTSVLGPDEALSDAALKRMPYLRAWLNETLRLYPAFPTLTRKLPRDLGLLGYTVPSGSTVRILSYFMGRDETVFSDAYQFKPERWIRNDFSSGPRDILEVASAPFGLGSVMCEARRIAELELSLLIAKTVQRFIVTYPHHEKIEPCARGVTSPDRPVRLKLLDRPCK